jgi:hypothetical protein
MTFPSFAELVEAALRTSLRTHLQRVGPPRNTLDAELQYLAIHKEVPSYLEGCAI